MQQPRDPAISRWGSLRTHLFSPALFAVRTSKEESWGGENPSLSSSFLWDFSTGPYLRSWVCGRGWAVETRIRCPSPSPLLVTLATPLRLSALGGLMLPTWRVAGGLRRCGSAQQTARPSGNVQDRERTSPFRDPRIVQGSLSPLPRPVPGPGNPQDPGKAAHPGWGGTCTSEAPRPRSLGQGRGGGGSQRGVAPPAPRLGEQSQPAAAGGDRERPPARPTSSSSVTVFLQLCSRVVKLDVVGEL